MSIFDIFKKKVEKKKGVSEEKKRRAVRSKDKRKTEREALPVEKKEKIKPGATEKEKGARIITRSGRVPIKEKGKKKEKAEALKEIKPTKPRKAIRSEVAWKVLKRPHITEKATDLTEENEYIFTVFSRANKAEVKKAVEDVYGVKVEKVRVVNIPPKKRRTGKTEGWRQGYKKAIVKIKKGQEIEVLPR